MTGDDRDLYEYFAALRREEAARVPPILLPSGIEPEHGRWRLRHKLVAATASLAMIAMALWLAPLSRVPHEGGNRERAQAASISSWKPATDFLMDTHDRELLQRVPHIGEHHRQFSKELLP